MMINALKLAITSLLLATFVVASANGDYHGPPPLDPKCPHGTRSGVQVNYYQVNVPVAGFLDPMKDFFELSWYSGAAINHTTGTDNKPGATRSGLFGDAYFTEQLVEYGSIPTSLYMRYINVGGLDVARVHFPSYTEQFGVDSICGGTATAIFFSVNYCANDTVAGAALYSQARDESIYKLSDKLGAALKFFEGNCPASTSTY